MKTLQDLRDELNHKVLSLSDLQKKIEKEARAMTPGEKSDMDALMADVAKIKAEIIEVEDNEKRLATINAEVAAMKQPQQRATTPETPGKAAGEVRIEVPGAQIRYGKLKAFKSERDAYIAGQWYRAAILGIYTAQRWCTENGINFRAHSEGTNTAGGALVPEQFSQAIIDLREKYSIFRQECDVMPMGSDTIIVPKRVSGLTASFVAENTAITDSQTGWTNVTLTAKKLAVLTLMSTELDEDAIVSMADILANEIAYAMGLKEDQCGFLGDGSPTYGGITGLTVKAVDAAYAGSKVEAAAPHNLFTELDAADLSLLMSKLPLYARPGAKWYCSQTAMDLVFGRLLIGGGGNTIANLEGGYTPRYLGYPIVVSQVLPAGAATDYDAAWMLGFGNLRLAATLGERRGISIKRSDERYFVEDQIAIKGTARIDINIHSLGDATNAGPFISLVGNVS